VRLRGAWHRLRDATAERHFSRQEYGQCGESLTQARDVLIFGHDAPIVRHAYDETSIVLHHRAEERVTICFAIHEVNRRATAIEELPDLCDHVSPAHRLLADASGQLRLRKLSVGAARGCPSPTLGPKHTERRRVCVVRNSERQVGEEALRGVVRSNPSETFSIGFLT
jgi:hypothetical protein